MKLLITEKQTIKLVKKIIEQMENMKKKTKNEKTNNKKIVKSGNQL